MLLKHLLMKNECLGLLLEELAEGLKNDVIEVLLFTTASSSSSSDLEHKDNKHKVYSVK